MLPYLLCAEFFSSTTPLYLDKIEAINLGNPASVRRSLQALVDKEMVFKEADKEGCFHYEIYNLFLSRWLDRRF